MTRKITDLETRAIRLAADQCHRNVGLRQVIFQIHNVSHSSRQEQLVPVGKLATHQLTINAASYKPSFALAPEHYPRHVLTKNLSL